MLHWVTNETAFEACTSFAIFPMKNMTLNGVCIKRWLRERQTQGKFSRVLARDGGAAVAELMWRQHIRGKCLCGAEVVDSAVAEGNFIILGPFTDALYTKRNNGREVKKPTLSRVFTPKGPV